eukprot:m.144576 g.144576  ORF g.144576 m.144576 type:complete len:160 (-) comp24256_c1_seq1:119-598(-)
MVSVRFALFHSVSGSVPSLSLFLLGGKVEANETIAQAAQRELKEEANIEMLDPTNIGLLLFEFKGDPKWLEVHVFRCTKYSGTITESEEMKPQWFSKDNIPFASMWKDDGYWFPLMLASKPFTGYFLFEGQTKVLEYRLEEGLKSYEELGKERTKPKED